MACLKKKKMLISWSILHVNSNILKYDINGLHLQKLTVYYSNGMFLTLVKFTAIKLFVLLTKPRSTAQNI